MLSVTLAGTATTNQSPRGTRPASHRVLACSSCTFCVPISRLVALLLAKHTGVDSALLSLTDVIHSPGWKDLQSLLALQSSSRANREFGSPLSFVSNSGFVTVTFWHTLRWRYSFSTSEYSTNWKLMARNGQNTRGESFFQFTLYFWENCFESFSKKNFLLLLSYFQAYLKPVEKTNSNNWDVLQTDLTGCYGVEIYVTTLFILGNCKLAR